MVYSLDQLGLWTKDWSLMEQFFEPDEIQTIREKLRDFQPTTIFCCSMESRFARSGGLAAVNSNSPAFLNILDTSIEAILVSPYHPNIIKDGLLNETGISIEAEWWGDLVEVQLFEHKAEVKAGCRSLSVTEYYPKAKGFWEAKNEINDPYVYTNDILQNDVLIRNDALFFCKTVPHVAKAIGKDRGIVFHLHEWQTALLSLVAKEAMLNGMLKSCGTVQTMHNPFDSCISIEELEALLSSEQLRKRVAKRRATGRGCGEMTAYSIGLSLVDAPINVVSEYFAQQFRSDILYTQYYVPHLQDRFANSLIGINNGPFVPFAEEFPKGESHKLAEVLQIKERQRQALLEILSSYHPGASFGRLTYKGGSICDLPPEIPILVMTGRLDTCQRGYDVFLKALEEFKEDELKAVLAPMPVKDSDLDYFHKVASNCNGNITVFPIRMEKGYHELQTGATFSIWPSVYEPFGGAIEYMLNGTPVIARETGGLVNQVDHRVNGILYLESNAHYNKENLEEFFHWKDIVQQRRMNLWFVDMVNALREALCVAIDIYHNEPELYCRMILNGFKKAKEFSWEKNSNEYKQIYALIGKV